MNGMIAERDAHRHHKHLIIFQLSTNAKIRRILRHWKSNVDSIHGRRNVHDKLSAVQHALQTAQENARIQQQTVERLRVELVAATRQNEMLQIVAGSSLSSVSPTMMGTPGR